MMKSTPPPLNKNIKYLGVLACSLLLLACDKIEEAVAPAGVVPTQKEGGPCTTCPPATDPNAFTTLYTDNVLRLTQANSAPPATMTFAPGATVYFLTRAINTPTTGTFAGTVSLTPYDTHLVTLEIAGTGTNTFYMLADRAGFVDDYGDTQTHYYTPPNAPFTGFYAQGYRGTAWKIPPYMPAGTYRVRLYSYQGGSPVSQSFSPTGATVAEGSLNVVAARPQVFQFLQYAAPSPTASSPIFGLRWPTSIFPNSSTGVPPSLRVMVRNTATNKYYALSPGYDDLGSSAQFAPSWEANVAYGNTGNAPIRYNSTTLYGGIAFSGAPTTSANTPQPVPAGYYQVYVDDKNSGSPFPERFLTTSGNPGTPIQLF